MRLIVIESLICSYVTPINHLGGQGGDIIMQHYYIVEPLSCIIVLSLLLRSLTVEFVIILDCTNKKLIIDSVII